MEFLSLEDVHFDRVCTWYDHLYLHSDLPLKQFKIYTSSTCSLTLLTGLCAASKVLSIAAI